MSPWAALIKQFPRPVIDLLLTCNRPVDALPVQRFPAPHTLLSTLPATLLSSLSSSDHFRGSLPVLSLSAPNITRRSRPDS